MSKEGQPKETPEEAANRWPRKRSGWERAGAGGASLVAAGLMAASLALAQRDARDMVNDYQEDKINKSNVAGNVLGIAGGALGTGLCAYMLVGFAAETLGRDIHFLQFQRRMRKGETIIFEEDLDSE